MYFKLYRKYFKLAVKNVVEYRVDFFIGIVSMLVEQVLSIVFLVVIFYNIPQIDEWKFEEILLMYAFSMLGRAIDVIFFDNFWTFGWRYVVTGKFDQILTKPMNIVFQLASERIQIHGIGYLITGFGTLIYSLNLLEVQVGIIEILVIIIFTIATGLIFSGINLFLMTFAFWIKNPLHLMVTTFTFSMIGRYPITIFPLFFVIITTFILPYSFTGYYPATFFFTGSHYSSISLLTPIVAILVWIVSYNFFMFGARRYVGAGN